MGEEGREDSGVINVTVIQSVATAAPINLTITPTEYSPTFGYIPPYDPATPNIATRMYATFLALVPGLPRCAHFNYAWAENENLLPKVFVASVCGNEVVDESH